MVLGKNLSYANKGLKLQIEIIEGDFLSLEFMCNNINKFSLHKHNFTVNLNDYYIFVQVPLGKDLPP